MQKYQSQNITFYALDFIALRDYFAHSVLSKDLLHDPAIVWVEPELSELWGRVNRFLLVALVCAAVIKFELLNHSPFSLALVTADLGSPEVWWRSATPKFALYRRLNWLHLIIWLNFLVRRVDLGAAGRGTGALSQWNFLNDQAIVSAVEGGQAHAEGLEALELLVDERGFEYLAVGAVQDFLISIIFMLFGEDLLKLGLLFLLGLDELGKVFFLFWLD